MTRLPIDDVVADVLRAIRDGAPGPRAAVLVAPTGAGKTTRVAPALLDVVTGRVILTEPRRLAARAAARRIAFERGGSVGGEVGYSVRHESKSSDATRLLVVTEGVLLRMLQDDPFLEGVGAVVFDEVHERSVDLDVTLAMVRQVKRDVRPDLAVVAMSATVEPAALAGWLGGAAVIVSEGRAYPVDVRYAPPRAEEAIEVAIARAVRDLAGGGDVLVFVPGMREIRRACEAIARAVPDVEVLQLHGSMEPEQQDAVVRGGARRRVVVSTNVAESSVTIPNVVGVVDTGLARVSRFDASAGLDRLVVERISRASADQRAGRAGRTAPGRCVRLWSEAAHARLAAGLAPELLRVDLAPVALRLVEWGERDPASFPWWTAPPVQRWDDAAALLRRLQCIDGDGLTALGRRIARWPLHPRLGCVVAACDVRGHGWAGVLAATVLAEPDGFDRSGVRDGTAPTSDCDVCDRVAVLGQSGGGLDRWVELRPGAAEALRLAAEQLGRAAGIRRAPLGAGWREAVRRAVALAFADRIAKRRAPGSARAVMSTGAGVEIESSGSRVRGGTWLTCLDVRLTERGDGRVWLASEVEDDVLAELVSAEVCEVQIDPVRRRVVRRSERRIGTLVWSERVVDDVDADTAAAVLASHAATDLSANLRLDEPSFRSLRARAAWVALRSPETTIVTIDDAALREDLPWLCAGQRSLDGLRELDLAAWARGRLGRDGLSRLDALAPTTFTLPTGRAARIAYPGEDDDADLPLLEARIQEVFGLHDTPRVLGGTVAIRVALLAPNGRPQQLTTDLRSFWSRTYQEVRKELRARYPKHAWPEDPWNALPQARPSRARNGG